MCIAFFRILGFAEHMEDHGMDDESDAEVQAYMVSISADSLYSWTTNLIQALLCCPGKLRWTRGQRAGIYVA